MAQIVKGTTYTVGSPGNLVTADNLNAHVDNAELLPGAITEQDELTATGNVSGIADTDEFLVSDSGVLKRIAAKHILPAAALTSRDELTPTGNVSNIADTDELLVSDAGVLKRIAAKHILPPGALTARDELTATLTADDVLLFSDTSVSGQLKKVKPQYLVVPEAISTQTELTTTVVGSTITTQTASADLALVNDGGVLKSAKLTNLIPHFLVSGLTFAAGVIYNGTHGLGETPRHVRAVLVAGGAPQFGYSAGDEVDVSALHRSIGGSDEVPAFTFGASATNVFLVCVNPAQVYMINKAGDTTAFLTAALWTVKIYASL